MPQNKPVTRCEFVRRILRELREDEDMTLTQIGVALGISRFAVSRIESGTRRIDFIETIDWLLAVHKGDREAARMTLEKFYDYIG